MVLSAEFMTNHQRYGGLQVVVANVNMLTTSPLRSKPSQVDRMQPMLQSKPQKLAFKMTASPPLPCSMFTGT